MSHSPFQRWIANKLDAQLLRKTITTVGVDRLEISQDGARTRIVSPVRGFAGSLGGYHLAILALVMALVTLGIPVAIGYRAVTKPGSVDWVVIAAVTFFAALTALFSWITFRATQSAVSQGADITCDPTTLTFVRTPATKPPVVLPLSAIKSVLIVAQFSVSLELLVVTHDGGVHRLLSGITRAELEEVATIVETYLGTKERRG